MLPWSGGWLDWDLHETRYYEWIEEIVEQLREDTERRAAVKQQNSTMIPTNAF